MIVFIAVVTSLIVAVSGQLIPQINQIILPEIKYVGMTGYLNCTVIRQEDNKVQWSHKESNMIITTDDRVEVDESINIVVDGYTKYDVVKTTRKDQNIYMLIVRRLVLTDSGHYTCLVNVKGYQYPPSKDGQLIVLMPPYIIQGATTQTVTVVEGGNANLTCNAGGFPQPNVSWVRVNGQTLPPPFNRYTVKGNVLQLTNIRAADFGMYRCVADNNVRPLANYDTTLYVQYRPRVRPVQSTYGQAQNRMFDLIIECIVGGYPTPDMKWYKQLQGETPTEIINDDKHAIFQLLSHGQQLSISEIWYQLQIINVQGNDYGNYTCQGTNTLGVGNYTIYVYETSECQGANCPPEGGQVSHAVGLHTSTVTLLSAFIITLTAPRFNRWSRFAV